MDVSQITALIGAAASLLCTVVVGALTFFMKKTLASLEEADKRNAEDIKTLDKNLNDLKADLPLIYVTREDYIRVMNRVEDMFKVACSRKEASCIIGSLLVELAPVCEKCGGSPDGVLNLQTEAGLSLTGNADVLITGHSIISGKPVRIKLTDYGFEYYGDRAELARVREKRCVYHGGTVSPAKEN